MHGPGQPIFQSTHLVNQSLYLTNNLILQIQQLGWKKVQQAEQIHRSLDPAVWSVCLQWLICTRTLTVTDIFVRLTGANVH